MIQYLKDFDECSVYGICDQICTNTPGSYDCSCVSGYIKKDKRCFAINGNWIYYMNFVQVLIIINTLVPKSENASLVYLTPDSLQRFVKKGENSSFEDKVRIINILFTKNLFYFCERLKKRFLKRLLSKLIEWIELSK